MQACATETDAAITSHLPRGHVSCNHPPNFKDPRDWTSSYEQELQASVTFLEPNNKFCYFQCAGSLQSQMVHSTAQSHQHPMCSPAACESCNCFLTVH